MLTFSQIKFKICFQESGIPSREVALQWIKKMARNGRNPLEKMTYSRMAAEIEKVNIKQKNIISIFLITHICHKV